jgi:preprotein translocase subunit SecG
MDKSLKITRSLVLYVCFVDRCLSFVLFILSIVLSVLLQYTDSDHSFGIFKHLATVLSVLLQYTDSDFPFGIFKLLSIVLSVLLQYTDSDYPFGIFKLLSRTRTDNTMDKIKSTNDKQRSTKHTYKTKDRVTRTPLKTEGELGCSGRVRSDVDYIHVRVYRQSTNLFNSMCKQRIILP